MEFRRLMNFVWNQEFMQRYDKKIDNEICLENHIKQI